jgi:hypothetical protein
VKEGESHYATNGVQQTAFLYPTALQEFIIDSDEEVDGPLLVGVCGYISIHDINTVRLLVLTIYVTSFLSLTRAMYGHRS